ncbi:MAG: DUF2894 domain-containing protein [Pseudomonadales bacterium]
MNSHEVIDAIRKEGRHVFDPVRFEFIESMARRALNQRESVRKRINIRVSQALKDYQADLDLAQTEAQCIIDSVSPDDLPKRETLQCLFQCYDFNGVKKAALSHQKNDSLRDLCKQMNLVDTDLNRDTPWLSLEDKNNRQPGELKSVQRFRESWAKLNSDKLVTRLIKEGPENPGPLNSHSLVIRSLTSMRELSPEYLSRFVSYIDTMLWLEKAGEKYAKTKTKAKTKSKSKSKTKKTPG